MEICVGRYGPYSRRVRGHAGWGGVRPSIVFWNAKNRGDQYITLAMSLMAVYNEGFPRRAASSTGGRSADRTSGPFSALAFIVLFVYSDDGDAKTPDRERVYCGVCLGRCIVREEFLLCRLNVKTRGKSLLLRSFNASL